MIRRLLSLFLSLLALPIGCGIGPARAQSIVPSGATTALIKPADASAEASFSVFKSGVKYDPTMHQWLDRYNGKPMDLGLPGVAGRYGVNKVLADDTLTGKGSTTTADTTSNSKFRNKKIFMYIVLGLCIATAIAVPVAVAVSTHDRHHNHQQITWQENRLAVYYYLHNKSLPVPKLELPPPPPPVEHSKPVQGY